MSEVERLRNELKKRRQAVTQKIARTKKQTGANISGTQFDPRREAGIEKRYNARQLRAHIAELNTFMQRGNQFVALKGGTPAPRGEWNVFARRQAEQMLAGQQHAASIGDLDTPLGMKAREMTSIAPRTYGSAVSGPYNTSPLEPSDIKDLQSLRKLSDAMLKRLKVSYLPTTLKQGRGNLEKALTALGEHEEIKLISELSEYQFDALWFGTTYAEITFLRYGMDRSSGDDDSSKERWQNRVVEDAATDAREFLQWAANEVPRTRPKA